MKDIEALNENIRSAAATLTKSALAINAGGLLLLGSLLNSLLTASEKDRGLIFLVTVLMYVGIAGLLFSITSQFRDLKLHVLHTIGSNGKDRNQTYTRAKGVFWITVIFVTGSYFLIAKSVIAQ